MHSAGWLFSDFVIYFFKPPWNITVFMWHFIKVAREIRENFEWLWITMADMHDCACVIKRTITDWIALNVNALY